MKDLNDLPALSKNRPSPTRLRELFAYCPRTGDLRNRTSRMKARAGELAGTLRTNGYIQVCVDHKLYRAHVLIWAMKTGEWPTGVVDHENGKRADNRWRNLRHVTVKINNQNSARSSRNTSGVTGVLWLKRERLWRAEIKIDGVRKELGYFKHKGDAVVARKAAEREHGFHRNHGRHA